MSYRAALLSACCMLLAASALRTAIGASVCGFDGLDFSSLMGTDIVGSDGGSTYKYYLSVCGTLTSPAASTCSQVQSTSSACQIQNPPNTQTFDIGNYNPSNPPTWSYTDASKTAVTYTMSGANQCWAQGSVAPYTAKVIFTCAAQQGQLTVTSAPQSCMQTYTLPTPLACAAAPPKSSCGFDGLDFSSLMGTDIVGSDGGNQYKYYLSLCGSLTSPAASSCVQVQSTSSACQIENPPNQQTFDIGNYDPSNPPTWSYTDATKSAVTFSLTGAQQCWAQGGAAAPYVATIVLKCAPSQGSLTVTSQPQACTKTFTLATPLACAAAPPTKACGWKGYDFSSLTGKNLPGSDGGSSYQYLVSVCGSLSPSSASASCLGVSSDTSVCQLGANNWVGDLGSWTPSTTGNWSWIDPAMPIVGVQYTVQGALQCWAMTGQPMPYITTVQFFCSRTQGEQFKMTHAANSCQFNASISTPLACPEARAPPPSIVLSEM